MKEESLKINPEKDWLRVEKNEIENDTVEETEKEESKNKYFFRSLNEKSELFNSEKLNTRRHFKLLELLNILGLVISGGLLSSAFALLYIAIHQQNPISDAVRKESYNIINFHFSFIIYIFVSIIVSHFIYFFISGIFHTVVPSVLIPIGIIFFLVAFLVMAYIILFIIGAIKRLNGESYTYPMTIKLIK